MIVIRRVESVCNARCARSKSRFVRPMMSAAFGMSFGGSTFTLGFGFFARWLGWLGLAVGIALYCRRPWQRLRTLGRDLSAAEQLAAGALVPVIRVVGDVAKMVGYPVGVWWRVKNKDKIGVDSAAGERIGHGD